MAAPDVPRRRERDRAPDAPVPPLASAPLAADLPARLAQAAPRVVVLGDAVLDQWLTGPSRRLSREAPVPVVEVDHMRGSPRAAVDTADAVVVCDYDGGLLDEETVAAVAEVVGAPGERACRLVVDAHDPARWRSTRPDVVTPNAGEAALLLGRELGGPDRVAAAEAAGPDLRERSGAAAVVVTLDRDGALLLPDPSGEERAPAHRTFARPAPESRTCGAGDTFTAALVLA